MNHVSILDDPLVWGATLPVSQLARPSEMRWALGAKDICFRNKAESLFFSLGQVLSVERFGKGPDQPSIDCSLNLLASGKWIHLYPEGFVHQPIDPYQGTLRYFHWGVSRLVLEGEKPPIVVPIYGTGLQSVFPEDQQKKMFGYGRHNPLVYTFGRPLNESRIIEFRRQWAETNGNDAKQLVRSKVAAYLREGVVAIKREFKESVEHDDDPRLGLASFWKSQTLIRLKGLSMSKKKEKSERA